MNVWITHARRLTVAPFHITALAIAVLVACTSSIATANAPAVTSGNPKVIVGIHDGPVDVAGGLNYATISSMAIPAGRWFITAKGQLQTTPNETVSCRLVAGADMHDMTTGLRQAPYGGGQWQSFVLMTTHRFTSPGVTQLRCVSTSDVAGAVVARSIRITAMSVGKLTTQTGNGSLSSVGSGQPEVRALRANPQVQLNGGMVLRDVASLALPAGLWWITAAASVGRSSQGDVTCRLETPVDFDDATTRSGVFGHPAPIDLQVTHRYPVDGTVRFRCMGDVDQYVTNTRIVAVRAGHLINRQVGGSTYDYGSGTPMILSAFLDDGGTLGSNPSTVASLPLSAGSWLLMAKLYIDGGTTQNESVFCDLIAGSRVDQVALVVDSQYRTIFPLVGAHHFGSGGGTAKLTCHTFNGLPIHAYWIKLTAFRVSAITQRVL